MATEHAAQQGSAELETPASAPGASGLRGPRRAVIIANTGTPDEPTPEAVGVYLRQFLSHPRICPMNPLVWKFILNCFILPKRRVASAAKYQTIWTAEGSQFLNDHLALAQKLTERYRASGEDIEVAVAMSFGNPSIPDVMGRLHEEGFEQLFVLPLYPQNAFSQAGIVADDTAACAARTGWAGRYQMVGDYSANELYLHAIADAVRDAGFDAAAGDHLLMSYHSIPVVDVQNGDTYSDTTKATSSRVAELLGLERDQWSISYQCRFDKERDWLTPFIHSVLADLAEKGVGGRLFVVCPNFSVDCLETYYDIGHEVMPEWAELLEKNGGSVERTPLVYVPCLNATDAHADVIMDVLAPQVLGRSS